MKLSRLRLSLVTLPAIFILLLALTSTAAAGKPDRFPNEVPSPFIMKDGLGNDPCGFEVQFDVLTNKEVVAFSEGQNGIFLIHITGAFKVRLTNLSTGKSIDVNISGPAKLAFNPDGTIDQILPGNQLYTSDPGVAPNLPRIALISGRLVGRLDEAGFHVSVVGQVQDVCAALAG